MSKTILITGTSTGLGIALAVQAAAAGHTVYATMRDLSKRAALDAAATTAGVTLHVLPLDVQNTTTITTAVEQIIAAHGCIDVLINNAGAGFVRSTEQATEAEINWVMDVNFMGVMRCTKAVMPHMRAARAGHIITISSVGGLVGQPFNEIYCAAKFAVEGYMESMASYITPSFGTHFTTVEPGGITTEFANSARKNLESTGGILADEYAPILMKYIGGAATRTNTGVYQTADEVAAVALGTLTTSPPPIRIRTSNWADSLCAFKTGLDPDGSKQQADVFNRFLTA
jgi:NAD(P)-dependent dehydrogenase (short-subunit alcohol dehydrogenase family)